jgi:hypothetical protein
MRPKLFVVRFANADTASSLFEQGVLDGAVLPSTKQPSSTAPKTPQEWYDKYYSFITPATSSELGGS